MKNAKKYLSALLALAVAAPTFTGCDNGLDEYPSDAQIPAPSDKFTTEIQFVSRLSDAALCSGASDYEAVHDYIVTTLDGRNGSWLTVLGRADNGDLRSLMGTAFDSYRWTTFAFNRIQSKTAYQGSILFVNRCLTESRGEACGAGCYVTGLTTGMKGVRTDKNDLGEVTGTTEVSFDVNVLTARFETADQISAFGGGDGVLRSFYDTNMPLLMIGTVKNDLFESLQAAGQSAGTSYGFNVFEVSKGSQYTLFLLTEERFWGFNKVETETIANGIESYRISVMW